MRMVGQMTQWNQMMSFPITCTLAGQNPCVLLSMQGGSGGGGLGLEGLGSRLSVWW
jgi:hypothetical protein